MIAARLVAIGVGLVLAVSSSGVLARESRTTPIRAGALRGTMLRSGLRAPVVLIVPGSGPIDRDGNGPPRVECPPAVRPATYRLLAEALAGKRISTVRIDKRGTFASGGGDPSAAPTVERYAADVRAWIRSIRRRTGKRCVWLLGHSEGALMVAAAARRRAGVCGLVLVSGAGRKFGDVLRAQLAANPANAPILEEARRIIDELEMGRYVDVTAADPYLRDGLFAPATQGYWISLFAADPVALTAAAGARTMVVQGSTDFEISVEDARLLARAVDAEPVILDGVNHVLKLAPLDRIANLATYCDPGLPLAPGVADVIAAFIRAPSRRMAPAP